MFFELKYKGSRNYLQGGDLFNAITGLLTERWGGHLARLVFKHIARNQCELLLDPPSDNVRVMGSGVWLTADGAAHRFWINETEIPVTESYPYDEDAISIPAHLDGAAIVGRHQNPYTVIENVIALTKLLNYALSPNIKGRWLFGQLDLTAALPESWQAIRIERTVCVGDSFSRNRIMIDGQEYGEIRFIVGEP